ncbi:MAG TPA: beta-propeller fold lactonase family protein [Conexibacter sp.]|nr:beta-propeller fold lactonase family protein [Conexibacter sp.]
MTRCRSLLAVLLVACGLLPAARAGADTLYVTDRQANVVHQFHVGSSGALSALNPASVATSGVNPTGIAVGADGGSVYTANGAQGVTWFGDVSQYAVSASGALAPLSPFSAFTAVDPDTVGYDAAVSGAHAYVTGGCCFGGFSGIRTFDVAAGGALTLTGSVAVAGVGDLVAHPTLARLYAATGSQIRRFDVEADGRLTNPANTTAAGVVRLAITPNGRHLYATAGTQDVLAFSIDGSTGRLTALGSATIPSGQVASLAASDSSVYVSESGTGVTQYDVGGDGRLTPKTPAVVDVAGSPSDVVLAPDGSSVYVASYASGDRSFVAQLDVGAGGALSPKSPATLVVGGTPEQLAVTTAGDGVSGPPGPPPPPPPPPPAPRVEPPARRIPINEVLLFRDRARGGFVGFRWDARGVATEIHCQLSRQSPLWCDTGVEIIDFAADNVRVVYAGMSRSRRRASKPTVLARGRIRLAPGATGTIRLTFTRAGRRALRGRRSLRAFALLRVKLGTQQLTPVQVRAKLTPRARRAPRRRR